MPPLNEVRALQCTTWPTARLNQMCSSEPTGGVTSSTYHFHVDMSHVMFDEHNVEELINLFLPVCEQRERGDFYERNSLQYDLDML